MSSTARTRARRAMTRELADAAFDYLMDHDFEAVTVDELSQVLGVSRATFFRYFETKEDVVVEAAAPAEHDFAAAVARLHAKDRDHPLQPVFQLLAQTLPSIEDQTQRLHARVRMVTTNASLGARLAARRGARQSDFADALTDWIGDREQAEVCSALGFACLDQAWRSWAREDEPGDLRERYQQVVRRARSLW